ncbi:MAG TPA: hypothetical protein VI055_10955 [Rubrobacter sp.]|jgi:hypothetical protein
MTETIMSPARGQENEDTALDAEQTIAYHNVYFISRQRTNRVEVGAMKWDLDLWYELWDRAGSQGLDTWYELRGEARDGPDTGHAPDAGPDIIEDGREGT